MGLYYPDKIINKGGKKEKIIGCIGISLVIIIAFLLADKKLGEAWLFSMRLIGGLSFWLFFDIFSFSTPKKWVDSSFVIYVMYCMIVKLLKLWTYFYLPHSMIVLLCEVLIYPILTVFLIILINNKLKNSKSFHSIWKIMTGSR